MAFWQHLVAAIENTSVCHAQEFDLQNFSLTLCWIGDLLIYNVVHLLLLKHQLSLFYFFLFFIEEYQQILRH